MTPRATIRLSTSMVFFIDTARGARLAAQAFACCLAREARTACWIFARVVLTGLVAGILISGGGFFVRVVFRAALLDAFITNPAGLHRHMRPIRHSLNGKPPPQ